MIGVAVNHAELPWVAEFFELFKTPWEPIVPGKRYEALVIADGRSEPIDTRVALVYGAEPHPVDERCGTSAQVSTSPGELRWRDSAIPVYGRIATFTGSDDSYDVSADGAVAGYRAVAGGTTVRRIAYDLFHEVSVLLSAGQPLEHAEVPTLELHIALIRQCLEDEGVTVLEIPPRPDGYAFVCCLTHDVDFFGIRRHRADRTLAGFVLRGTFGTLLDVFRGRRPVSDGVRNLIGVISLPLVFTGVSRDLWHPFNDYADADRGHPSTFYLVPFKNQPGINPEGVVESRRSVAYDVRDLKTDVKNAARAQTEFAVHGLDAWRDADAGRAEIASVSSVTEQQKTGVRMHWLYFSQESPRCLEEAGFDYDSTCGYNDGVGYRAGTLQVFKLPGSNALLELPLAIMDTAMLYPGHMALRREEVSTRSRRIVADARRFGGALVINWHDRSLAPERQWRDCYNDLLNEVEGDAPWFATASEAVEWFRWRRSIRFESDRDSKRVKVQAPDKPLGVPPAALRVNRRGAVEESSFSGGVDYVTP
jgi:hypothetical protein